MLQVEFDQGALARLRVARGSDALWETVLSLQLLQNGQESLTYGPWRREVRDALHRAGLADDVRALMSLCPPTGYFPDFLTPGLGDLGLEDAVDRVLSTPRRRLATELDHLCSPLRGPVPSSVRWVATGDPAALRRLGDTLRRYHALAVAPYLSVIRARAGQDRARRAEAALAGGAEALLASYAELPGWRRPDHARLATPYPESRLLRLGGRPLTLVPAFFCVRAPLALVDESLPHVLVHPLGPEPGWLPRFRAGGAGPSVAQLIGTSRARVLAALEAPLTTTALATALRLAPSTASRHAAVLREAGLVATRREGNRVLHRRTGLGSALLEGQQVGTPGSQASATSMKMLET
ncbi:helix-turn-helix domain-containing protein [Streptomyces sp. NPDC021139]|uniref:helix-turn-helix domain-containing protein n=1 Tax=unclassified Streptomyces TaxID=2593676 RepID=UPI0033F01593